MTATMTTDTSTTATTTSAPSTAAPAPATDRVRGPWDAWVVVGLTVVAVTAFVASFYTLANLAGVAGWGGRVRWLLPLCIDALALAAARVWLSGRAPEPARRYARVVAMAAVATSVVGNAVGHLVGAGYLHTRGGEGMALVIVVGSVPAVALGAVAHLATLASVPVKSRRARKATPATTAASVPAGTAPAAPAAHATKPRGTAAMTGAKATCGKPASAGRGGDGRDKAWAHWQTERAAGRTPSGAELARVGGVDASLGRRWRREWQTSDDTAGAGTAAGAQNDEIDTSASEEEAA